VLENYLEFLIENCIVNQNTDYTNKKIYFTGDLINSTKGEIPGETILGEIISNLSRKFQTHAGLSFVILDNNIKDSCLANQIKNSKAGRDSDLGFMGTLGEFS
jgi:hypothetical protein